MINSKRKGNNFENKFANWLKDNGIKAWKDGASGGGTREKADVGNNLNLHFEIKAVKRINLQEVWKKALLECGKTHNDPVIAIHFDGMKDDNFLMVLDNHHFLDILQKSQGEKIVVEVPQEDSRDKKYAIQQAITYLKRLEKYYE